MNPKQITTIQIGIVVIALVAGVYYFATKSNNPTPPTETPQNSTTPIVTQEKQIQKTPEITEPATNTDQKSLTGGWQEIILGSDQITKDNDNFSISISDLGKTIEPNDTLWGLGCSTRCQTRTTQGKFIQVDFKVNNTGLESEYIEFTPANASDQTGRLYPNILTRNVCNSTDQFSYYTGNAQTLKPNIPCVMKVLYEVSQDSTSFTAKLFYKKGK